MSVEHAHFALPLLVHPCHAERVAANGPSASRSARVPFLSVSPSPNLVDEHSLRSPERRAPDNFVAGRAAYVNVWAPLIDAVNCSRICATAPEPLFTNNVFVSEACATDLSVSK